METYIHPTAVIGEEVVIGDGVYIGPGAMIHNHTHIGDGCYIHNHATIGSPKCRITMGKGNEIFPGAVIGGVPQDLKYSGESTETRVGDNNIFRECVTVNAGTVDGGGVTRVGSHCLIMAYCHIAHDCHIGDHVVVANSSNFAGHVTAEDHVKIGGVCSFNQFVRLGAYSYITGESSVNKDIMPFTIARGNYAISTVTNKIGLERAGFSKEEIDDVHRAVRVILKSGETMGKCIETIQEQFEDTPPPLVSQLLEFTQGSERGIAR